MRCVPVPCRLTNHSVLWGATALWGVVGAEDRELHTEVLTVVLASRQECRPLAGIKPRAHTSASWPHIQCGRGCPSPSMPTTVNRTKPLRALRASRRPRPATRRAWQKPPSDAGTREDANTAARRAPCSTSWWDAHRPSVPVGSKARPVWAEQRPGQGRRPLGRTHSLAGDSTREAVWMQDAYVGDVGDFGKYGLLRALCTRDPHGEALIRT